MKTKKKLKTKAITSEIIFALLLCSLLGHITIILIPLTVAPETTQEIPCEEVDSLPRINYFTEKLGFFDDGDYARDVRVIGNIAYVSCESEGLEVINVSDSANPYELGQYTELVLFSSIDVAGDIAYVTDYGTGGGLIIINVSNPIDPQYITRFDNGGGPIDVHVEGDIAYVADVNQGLEIINVSNPASPQLIYTYINATYTKAVYVSGDFIYVGDRNDGLEILNRSTNKRIGFCDYRGGSNAYGREIVVDNGIAYVADDSDGLKIINVTDPTNPQLLSEYNKGNSAFDVFVSGNIAYVACDDLGLKIIDLSNLTNPKEIGQYYDGSGLATGVDVLGNIAYIADSEDGLEIIDIYAVAPNPPMNLSGYTGLNHINLTWDAPSYNGGSPITQYNIYRGISPGGSKSFIGSSVSNNFSDSTVDFAKWYYYSVRAENIIGESNESAEIQAMAAPLVQWETPAEEELIIFPMGNAVFNFSYNSLGLVNATLEINGTDFGSVWGINSTILSPYTTDIDGRVNATLYGYEEGNPIPIVNDTRTFTFSKITSDNYEILESRTEYIGQKLYLILHDPNGDNSFTSYEETAQVSLGVGCKITAGAESSVEIGEDFEIFDLEFGYSNKLTTSVTSEVGLDFRFDITDTTQITSSQESSDPDYIGPGYGDRYWGEAWTLRYISKAHHRIYFNGSEVYEDPKIYYGIIRGGEVILNDNNAPASWKALNPVHNGWQNVSWFPSPLTVGGGGPVTDIYDITSSLKTSAAITIGFGYETTGKVPGIESTVTLNLETKFYADLAVTTSYKIGYEINDDEAPDTIVQRYGIDERFGTFIFNTTENFCQTSYPLEHNTFDYIPPIIDFPNINLDSSQDGLSPCQDDSPIITVDIFDEGGIQSALIWFTINNGGNWDSSVLSEQVANSGTWQATIPSHNHGTTVLWYINVCDLEGSGSTRKNPNGNNYKYTVINRAPTITLISPNGGNQYKDTVSIKWAASDPDEDSLTYTLAYSDGGGGWYSIEEDIKGKTSYEWDISDIPYSDSILIKIVAYDGFGGQAEDESDFLFTIGDPPLIEPSIATISITLIAVIGGVLGLAMLIFRSNKSLRKKLELMEKRISETDIKPKIKKVKEKITVERTD